MRIFPFFSSASPKPPLQDKKEIEEKYRYWRIRTFYGMYFGYILYYFTRKSFIFIMPALQKEGFDIVSLGLIGSSLSIMYGVSKFVSGLLGDQSNPRYFMAAGLIITGICNILFSFSSSLLFFTIFWGLNGWFQGWGWPGCAKLLTHWYAQSERGMWWSLWNTSHNLGGALIPIIIGLLAQYFNWRVCMCIPGVLCILGGFFLINRLRDTPESLGLPAIEVFKKEKQQQKLHEEAPFSMQRILFRYVLRNPYVWALACSNFFVYVIRTAVHDWSFLFYYQHSAFRPHYAASVCCCAFELGGLVGSLSAGWLSDRVFLGRRNPVNIFYLVGMLIMVFLMAQFSYISTSLNGLFMFLTGFFIFGPQMLIGMAATELSHKKAAATASGFTGCLGYLGAAFAGLPLGHAITRWGWDGYFFLLGVCAVCAGVILLPLWSAKDSLDEEKADALA